MKPLKKIYLKTTVFSIHDLSFNNLPFYIWSFFVQLSKAEVKDVNFASVHL